MLSCGVVPGRSLRLHPLNLIRVMPAKGSDDFSSPQPNDTQRTLEYSGGGCMAERNSWKLNEIVVLVILSIAIGILFWGWTFLQALASPLKPFGLDYLFAGVWFMGGTLVPYLIRRRGLPGRRSAGSSPGRFHHSVGNHRAHLGPGTGAGFGTGIRCYKV